MSNSVKNFLLIIGLILTASLIGFGLYWVFIKGGVTSLPTDQLEPGQPTGQLPSAGERPATGVPTAPTQPSTSLPTAGELPTPEQPGVFRPTEVSSLATGFITNPSVGTTGNLRFHNAADGKFYKIGADGKMTEMSDQVFYNVSNVTWASTQDKAVLEYPDGSKIVYDFLRQRQTTSLPKHWQEFSFSPDGNQIAAKSIGLAPENRWLVVTNDDGTNTELIEPLGNNADKVQVDWSPSRQVVAFSKTGESLGFDRAEILLVGLNHENFKSLTVEGRGFIPQWSTTGKKLLYSVYSNRTNLKPELWVTDAYGDNVDANRQMLNINTWADKCTFGGDNTLYCAVPKTLPEGAALSRSIADSIEDELFKIDLTTGLKTQISVGDNVYSVKNINYDANKNALYFTDINKSGIFEVGL